MNKYFSILILVIFAAAPAEAARFNVESAAIGAGTLQEIRIQIDTEGEELNAIEGAFRIPDGVEVERVSDANSIFNLWVERPRVESGRIVFSGLTPGGFSGQGILFNVRLKVMHSGEVRFDPENLALYRNDGAGTRVPVESPIIFHAGTDTHPLEDRSETDPPERFNPEIVRDPLIHDGQYVLVFQTQDKGSGMDHYEIMEVPTGLFFRPSLRTWERAESPFVLTDQTLRSDILVRAVDREGNFIIVTVPAKVAPLPWSHIILGVILICLIVIWRFHRRRPF